MKKLVYWAPVALLLMGAECEPGETDDSGDSGESCWYDGDLQIASIAYDCTPTTSDLADRTGTWTYEVTTDGLAGSVGLEILETNSNDPWSESHDLTNTSYDDECGTWDQWDLSLSQVDNSSNQVANTNSFFGCAHDNAVAGVGGSLAWEVTMYDDSNAPLDCAIWGRDANTHFTNAACVCFDVDGNCAN